MAGLFHSRAAGSLSNWITLVVAVGGVLSTVFAVLSKLSQSLLGELTWPEAILVGIAESLIVLLAIAAVLAIGAWAFRLIKPVPTSQAAYRPTDASQPVLSEDQIIELIRQHVPDNPFDPIVIERLEEKLNAMAADPPIARELKMTGHALALAETVTALESAKKGVEAAWEKLQPIAGESDSTWYDRFDSVEESLNQISTELSKKTGGSFNFLRAPVFDSNPERPVPGEEWTDNTTYRRAFRRAYDQVQYAERVLLSRIHELRRELDSASYPLNRLLALLPR